MVNKNIKIDVKKLTSIINSNVIKEIINKRNNVKSIKSKIIEEVLRIHYPEILDLKRDNLISVRSVTLNNKTIKESVSFCQLNMEKMSQDFNNSEIHKKIFDINHIFFVFNKENNLIKIKIIDFNNYKKEKELCKEVYDHTRNIFINGEKEEFIKMSDKKVWHIRPKAKDSDDKYYISGNRLITKRAFWINKDVLNQIIKVESIH